MRAVEVVEVDVDHLTEIDRRALGAFEQTMWAEQEPQAIENVHDLTAHRSKMLTLAESESGM